MAEASVPVKYLDDITDCPICTEVYTDPRFLPCIHTYCLKCITSWGKDKQPGDLLACPLCRKEIKIPAAGIGDLPKNLFVEKVLEVRKLSTGLSTTKGLCDVCADDDAKPEEAKAVKFHCMDCRQDLCAQCGSYHRKTRATNSHRLIETDPEKRDEDMLLSLGEPFCQKHRDESLKVYCFDCKSCVCLMCCVTGHKSHNCLDVKEVAEELKKQMIADVNSLAGAKTECGSVLEILEAVGKNFTEVGDRAQEEIVKKAEELKSLVDKCRDELLVELNQTKAERVKKMESLRHEVEGHMMVLDSFTKYSEELRRKGTACDVARTAGDLRERAEELRGFNIGRHFNAESCSVDIGLSSPWMQLEDVRKLFGKLTVSSSDDIFLQDIQNLFVEVETNACSSRGDDVCRVRAVHTVGSSQDSQKILQSEAGAGGISRNTGVCGYYSIDEVVEYVEGKQDHKKTNEQPGAAAAKHRHGRRIKWY